MALTGEEFRRRVITVSKEIKGRDFHHRCYQITLRMLRINFSPEDTLTSICSAGGFNCYTVTSYDCVSTSVSYLWLLPETHMIIVIPRPVFCGLEPHTTY